MVVVIGVEAINEVTKRKGWLMNGRGRHGRLIREEKSIKGEKKVRIQRWERLSGW